MGSFANKCVMLLGFWGLVLAVPALQGATYYVSPSGSDTNNGTLSLPFQTVNKSVTVAKAGDTVLVQPGIYDQWVRLTNSGTSGKPITFKANGAVTNLGSWFVYGSSQTVDGFEFTGRSTSNRYYGIVYFYPSGVSNCWIINNKIHDTPNIYPFGGVYFDNFSGTNTDSSCVISNNMFYNVSAIMIVLDGSYQIACNNWMSNAMGSDAFGVWGHDQAVRANFATRIDSTYGDVEHPDFIQTFGPQPDGTTQYINRQSYNILVEDNIVINGDNGGSICQLECNNGTNAATVHDWTFRNNVFANIANSASVDIPNCHWFNNIFYHCVPINSCICFAWFDPKGATPRGQAYGGQVKNNSFIACGGSQYRGWYGYGVQSGFTPNPPPNLLTNCDYNFVCMSNWGAVSASASYPTTDQSKFNEPHGINGGNPMLANAANNDFHLLSGSPLIGAGTTLSGFGFNTDLAGTARTDPWDIGAYAYLIPLGAPGFLHVAVP